MPKLREWLLLQAEPVTLAIAVTAVAIFAAGATALFWTVGSSERVEGRLVDLGMIETEMGSRRVARVQAGERILTVRLPVRHACRIGDRVALRRYRLWWGGNHITAALPPCPLRSSPAP